MTIDWQALGKQAIALGAPTIGAALGGPVGAQIGGVLAAILGVDPTPEAVGGAIAEDPGSLTRVEAVPGADLTQWLLVHAQTAAALATSETARETWFSWGWRPALSWLLMVLWSWAILIQPVLEALTHLGLPPVPLDSLLGFTGIWLTIYGGGHTLKAVMAR